MKKRTPHLKTSFKLLRLSRVWVVKRCRHTICSPPDLRWVGCELRGTGGFLEGEGQMPNDQHICFLNHFYKERGHTTVISCYQLFVWDQGSELKPSFVTAVHWLMRLQVSPSCSLQEGIQKDLPELLSNSWVSKAPLGFGWKESAGCFRMSLLALIKHSSANMDSGPRPPAFKSSPGHLLAVCDHSQVSQPHRRPIYKLGMTTVSTLPL